MDKVDEKKHPWHLVKLDDNSYKLIKRKRDEMKRRGHHASYGDAIRELLHLEELNEAQNSSGMNRPKIPRIK